LKGAFWTIAARIVTQATQFIVMLTAARQLGPEEFGVFALVSAFSMLLLVVSKLGWFEQIQQRNVSKNDFDVIFWTSLAIAVCVFGLGLIVAGTLQLAGFRLGASTLAIFMFWIVAATITSVQYGVIMRELGVAPIGQAQIMGEIVAAIVSIAFLKADFSIMSIALGRLTGEIVAMGFAAARSRWAPALRNCSLDLRRFFPFVSQIFYVRVIGFAQQNLAVFLIGALIGPAGAGLFRVGARFSGAIMEIVQEPVRLSAWSLLGRSLAEKKEPLGVLAGRIIVSVLFVSAPLFVGLAATADSVVAVLLGPQWAAAAPVITILCLANLLQIFAMVNEPLLTLSGHVNKIPRISLISTTGVLGGLLLFAPFGLFWTAIGLLTSSGLSLILTYWVSSRYGDVNWAQIGRECWPAFVASALMAAGVLAMKHTVLSGADSLLSLALQVVVGSVVFSAAIRVLAPHRFDIALEFVSKASSHGRK